MALAHRLAGRQTTTRIHYTEAEIRREHPETVRVEASRVVVELPETAAERQAAMRQRGDRGDVEVRQLRRPDTERHRASAASQL